MSENIEWADPPNPDLGSRKKGSRQAFVRALSERPGTWGKYPKPVTHGASAVISARQAFPGTEWSYARREDGRYDLYARVVS